MALKYIAKRQLLFSEKNTQLRKQFTIKISEPFVATQEDAGFSVDGTTAGCHVDIEGLQEPGFDLFGMDSLQAVNIASNIEPLIEKLSKKYDFFWLDGEPYFDE